MTIKYGNKWYDVLGIREEGGIERYAVLNEYNDIDWIANPEEIILDEE